MISIAALAAIALLLGGAAGPVLARGRWPLRLPGTAIAAWLGVLAGTLAALTGLVATALFGRAGLGHHVIEWLLNYLKHHKHPSSDTTYLISVLPLAAALGLTLVAARRYRRTIAQRRHHREALGFVTHPSRDFPDVRLIDHPMPVVYCLPERDRQIVMSSGALHRLDAAELQAVLSHERAHLDKRHHLILTLIDAAGAALAWLPSFRAARDRLPPLAEMAADDEAARNTGPDVVAAALRKLAIAPCPAGGLAAGPADRSVLAQRLARLEGGNPPHGTYAHLLSGTAIALSIIIPVVVCAAWADAIPLFC
ncbi:M56 family metallopeptidase [Actinoallomurus iriomotensis]|uniref:Integral membrane protein n=1 Tax=Actinoallomurus iriomotensis TaxID=478107 RepID=A0A9W6RQJ8_9ACTN|nr:M56 family metallopeptidase [Actinoallomurus iriomotensis]GLY79665.1 integral membrane protein [Actinoallomurus iriomotensis]